MKRNRLFHSQIKELSKNTLCNLFTLLNKGPHHLLPHPLPYPLVHPLCHPLVLPIPIQHRAARRIHHDAHQRQGIAWAYPCATIDEAIRKGFGPDRSAALVDFMH